MLKDILRSPEGISGCFGTIAMALGVTGVATANPALKLGAIGAAALAARLLKDESAAGKAFRDAVKGARSAVEHANDTDFADAGQRERARIAAEQLADKVADLSLDPASFGEMGRDAASDPQYPLAKALAARLLEEIAPGTLLTDDPWRSMALGTLETAFEGAIAASPGFYDHFTLELVRDTLRDVETLRTETRAAFTRLSDMMLAAAGVSLVSPGLTLQPATMRAQPASVLIARYRVVPFDAQLGPKAQLAAWVRTPADGLSRDMSVRLVTGAGGLGKTRTAIELLDAMEAEGWAGGFVPRDALAHPQFARLICQAQNPAARGLLLVADYAENAGDGLAKLIRGLRAELEAGGLPIRLLLLARAAGAWWTDAADSTEAQGLVIRTPLAMETEGFAPAARLAFFCACAEAFGARLGANGQTVVAAPAPPELDADLFDRPLTVAMAAFLAVIGQPADAGGLFDALLAEEDKNWARAAGPAPAGEARALRKASIRNAAAQATLLQGAPAETLVRLRKADPLLEGEPPAEAKAAVAALRLLYPGADGAAAPLEPDLLGEAMLARACGDAHRLALLRAALADALACADGDGVRRALTVAIRMSWHPEAATRDAAAALLADWEAALVPTLDDAGLGLLEGAIPWETTALRALAAAAAQARLDAHPAVADGASETVDAEQARRWDALGVHRSKLGRREEALAATQRAVAIRETLAARNPDAFNPDLAGSLSNLGVLLSNLGRREEALAATQRAVALYETLAARNPDAFNPDLAMSLSNLGVRLSILGRRDEALAATQRAVALYETLAVRNPDAFNPDLAGSLSNLGLQLSDLGRRDEALAATQRAVALFETLVARNPDAFNPDLAASLSNLGIWLSNLGRPEEALAAEERAVAIRETLAAGNPDVFNPDLARSLSNLGIRLSNLGRREEALAATQRAVGLYETLAVRNPDAFNPDLAGSLSNLGIRLSHLGRRDEALAATERAVGLYETLAVRNPDAFNPDLAGSLSNLGIRLSDLGRRDEALAAEERAVAIRETLAARNPDAFNPDLARSRSFLGDHLMGLGRAAEAVAAYARAARILRPIRDAHGGVHRGLHDRNLAGLRAALAATGLDAAAIAAWLKDRGLD